MGTRNLTIVTYKKVRRVAQYCQWDGYPTGQGFAIVDILKDANMRKLKTNLNKVKFLSNQEENEVDKRMRAVGIDKFLELNPQWHRDTGPQVLRLIESGKVTELTDSSDFENDGLFCEWAYNIDLDKNQLRVKSGWLGKTYIIDLKGLKTDSHEWARRAKLRLRQIEAESRESA